MVRVHSSTHLKDDGAGKRKMRQFAAGKLTRNSSHTMLPRIRSNESFGRTDRPYIGRSRSSGDVLRYNKSGLRLGSLTVARPHHKTRSLINLTGRTTSLRGTKHKVIIDLGSSDNESGDGDGEASPEEVDSFHDKADIARNNEKALDNNQKKKGSTEAEEPASDKDDKDMKHEKLEGRTYSQVNKNLLIEPVPEGLRQEEEEKSRRDNTEAQETVSNGNDDHNISRSKSKDSIHNKNFLSYNADYLLSQSTGQEKPIYKPDSVPDHHRENNREEKVRNNGTNGTHISKNTAASNLHTQMQAVSMNQSNSSASLLFRQSGLNLASANSFYRTNRFTPARLRDFRPSNQRKVSQNQNETKQTQSRQEKKTKEVNSTDFSNNFSSYMADQQPELQTRTQQKLWLQRENISSLVDIADSNNPFTTNATRLEYEKLSREYLSIRRFSNPMLRLLDKVREIPALSIQKSRPESALSAARGSTDTTLGIASKEEPFRGNFDQFNKQAAALWKKYSDQFYSGKGETLNADNKEGSSSKEVNAESTDYYEQSRSATSRFRAMPRRYQPTTRAQQKLAASSSMNLVNLQH